MWPGLNSTNPLLKSWENQKNPSPCAHHQSVNDQHRRFCFCTVRGNFPLPWDNHFISKKAEQFNPSRNVNLLLIPHHDRLEVIYCWVPVLKKPGTEMQHLASETIILRRFSIDSSSACEMCLQMFARCHKASFG